MHYLLRFSYRFLVNLLVLGVVSCSDAESDIPHLNRHRPNGLPSPLLPTAGTIRSELTSRINFWYIHLLIATETGGEISMALQPSWTICSRWE